MSHNITKHNFKLGRIDKQKITKTHSHVLWLYGLSGSGKSTIANELEHILHEKGKLTRILDGDDLRHGLNNDLSFTQEDRNENLRRAAEVANLFCENGMITICCFITPLKSQRQIIKNILKDNLTFIFVDTDLSLCEQRDPKGLYKKARSGELKNFTGIDSDFQPSENDFSINTKLQLAP